MDSITKTYKPHAVCLPFPTQGHISPMLKLAILLHNRGFHVTFVNSEYNHRRLFKSGVSNSLDDLPDDFQFETIPDGLPASADADSAQDIPSLCDSTRKNCLAPFRELLMKLNASADSPPVTCIIPDAIMSFAVVAAKEIGVPSVCFRTTNACNFFANKYVPLLIEKGLIPLKDLTCLSNGYLDTTLDFIPEMKNVRLKDFPSFIRTTDINDLMLNIVLAETEGASKASALIFNSFDALEADILNGLSRMCPPIYAIGPLHFLISQLPAESSLECIGGSLWKEDHECLHWLDSKAPKSVVYVNFGSITVLNPKQLEEFAWGLANSKKNFLWIIRQDLVVGESAILPPEFTEETKERGIIAGWCHQEQVLKHSSIGGFLTHCGWNSILESLSCGVPMICWPFFADQHINCRYACAEWGVGMEMNVDVHRNNVEALVRELMDGEKGQEIKEKAMEWKRKAEEATGADGSSYLNLNKLVEEVLLSKV